MNGLEPPRRMFGRAALCGALLAVLAGCMVPAETAGPPPWWTPFVTVDPMLPQRGMRGLDFVLTRNAGGFARLAGEFRNRSEWKLSAAYRVVWLDDAGQPANPGVWRAAHALPLAAGRFADTAPRDDVNDFRVEMLAIERLDAPDRAQ